MSDHSDDNKEQKDGVASIEHRLKSEHPPIPAGSKVTYEKNPKFENQYPVICCGPYTYWPYSYINNAVAMNIVKYDSDNKMVKQWNAKGARYIYDILNDSNEKKITFIGQAEQEIIMTYDELGLLTDEKYTVEKGVEEARVLVAVSCRSCTLCTVAFPGTYGACNKKIK